MQNFLGMVTIDSWVLYVIMGVLLLGNIAFIIMFVKSVMRNNELEDRIQNDLREKIKETEYDRKRIQPLDAQPKEDGNYKYKVVESAKKDGFFVEDKQTKEKLGFAKTKSEANEIIKELARK